MFLSSRSEAVPVPPSKIIIWVSDLTTNQCFQVAILTALVYHSLTTIDKEVKYFWNTKGRIIAIVYFMNRYIGILGAAATVANFQVEANLFFVNFQLCDFAEWTRILSYGITIISIDYILMSRVLALYSHQKMLRLCLMTLLALEAVVKLAVAVFATVREDVFVGALAEADTVCGRHSGPPFRWGEIDWVIPMVYSVILMVLALYKTIKYWNISTGSMGSSLFKVIIQDQIIYFILVVASCAINIVDLNLEMSDFFGSSVLSALGSPSLLCILGSQMVLNMKDVGARGFSGGTSYEIGSSIVTDVEFS